MAAVASLYRRTLPSPPAIEFASPEGKQLFSEALQEGHMEGFFQLISYYQTQSEPAYCGLATISVVLNALAIDPGRMWKGPWRWFDDSMLDCCEPLEKIKVNGISFGKVACLAHCNGARVEALRTNESTIDKFRKYVMSCTSSENCHVIVSYHRGYLEQTGTGHFSPIGGYHAGRDMVLILDVARFKYPPHWVPLSLLWTAMDTVDEDTGQHRGFMLLSRLEKASSILYTLNFRHESWGATAKYLSEEVPRLLSLTEVKTIEKLLDVLYTSALSDLRDFINWIAEVRSQDDQSEAVSQEERNRLRIKVNGEDSCSCNPYLSPLSGRHPSSFDILAVLFLALPPNTWSGIRDEKLREEICDIVSTEKLPPLLQEEVLHIRRQLHLLSTGT